VLFAPGFACTPAIWAPAREHLPHVDPVHAEWAPRLTSLEAARDHLHALVADVTPDAYVGHSMGGLLLLELIIARRIPVRPAVIVESFLADPHDMFKNFVWDNAELRDHVTRMLDEQRPRFAPLRGAISSWQRSGWPEAAIHTGAHFVYGGRGQHDAYVIDALAWPQGLASPARLSIIPHTSHFLMLEAAQPFYALVDRLI
jgi:pimeloyl-ACP methyl ester carboxylesterase